jgi:hypothetical protein
MNGQDHCHGLGSTKISGTIENIIKTQRKIDILQQLQNYSPKPNNIIINTMEFGIGFSNMSIKNTIKSISNVNASWEKHQNDDSKK